jgi:ferredoxin
MIKIIFEREKCIGCGSCSVLCAKYWQMADDEKANLLGGKEKEGGVFQLELEEVECNQEAAQACPVQCIHVEKH